MQIIVNDFLTNPVKLSRGVRQADALAPMLYVLCVEVLACTIRNSSQIEGAESPVLPGLNLKSVSMQMIQLFLSRKFGLSTELIM